MPCNSDYMEPTALERERKRAAKLLVYVQKQLGIRPLSNVVRQASHIYGANPARNPDQAIVDLCAVLRSADPEKRDTIVYNGRDPVARDLADWWDKHTEADREREQKEQENERFHLLYQQAVAKLTPDELEAVERYHMAMA